MSTKLDTVRKLLAKAEGASTPAEAEAFTAKATELMARYSIDSALLAEATRDDRVVKRTITLTGYAIAKAVLLNQCAEPMGVRLIMTAKRGDKSTKIVTMYGRADDVEAFDLLATSLLLQATTAATVAHRSAPHVHGRTFRHSFLLGFGVTVGQRLTAQMATAVAETDDQAGTALVLVSRMGAVDTAIATDHRKLKSRNAAANVDATSFRHGERAGRQADLGGRTRVGSTSTKELLH